LELSDLSAYEAYVKLHLEDKGLGGIGGTPRVKLKKSRESFFLKMNLNTMYPER
jgi:hypothetical protein